VVEVVETIMLPQELVVQAVVETVTDTQTGLVMVHNTAQVVVEDLLMLDIMIEAVALERLVLL
jgi:hypothetical protein